MQAEVGWEPSGRRESPRPLRPLSVMRSPSALRGVCVAGGAEAQPLRPTPMSEPDLLVTACGSGEHPWGLERRLCGQGQEQAQWSAWEHSVQTPLTPSPCRR